MIGKCVWNDEPTLALADMTASAPTPASTKLEPFQPPASSSTSENNSSRVELAAPVPLANPPSRVSDEFEKYMTEEESKREAVRRFPEIGIAGSKSNTEFIRRYHEYRRNRPDFFRENTWPLRLAEEIAIQP
ncbi:MAG TPA: hypothetical protein VFG14_00745 [Chthoniobacteraceae bacterium]|jgi:hypothetical protein|nr:hypothetical protein [Chthoniobacteraceae bacterium]